MLFYAYQYVQACTSEVYSSLLVSVSVCVFQLPAVSAQGLHSIAAIDASLFN